MKDIKYTILSNEALTRDVYRMVLEGDTSECIRPGQFIEIRIPGRYLRRPISICDYEEGKLTIIYKVVGEGTMDMSTWKAGQSLEALCALGNGYDVAAAPDREREDEKERNGYDEDAGHGASGAGAQRRPEASALARLSRARAVARRQLTHVW